MGPVDNACHTDPRPVWRIIDGCPIALLLFSIPGRYWPHGLTISTIWHRKVRVRPNRYEPIFAIFARGQFQNSFDWSASCIFIHDVVHFHTRLYSRSREHAFAWSACKCKPSTYENASFIVHPPSNIAHFGSYRFQARVLFRAILSILAARGANIDRVY